jgi:hypothetical protein
MGIASPFVGVKNNTFLPLPSIIQKAMAWQFGQSGTELFFFDSDNPLIVQMCLNQEYLAPIGSFKRRILYAALVSDFMVLLEVSMHTSYVSTENIYHYCLFILRQEEF